MADDTFVHVDRAPTQSDWDALDPDTYETTCADCGTPYDGRFGPDHNLATPCPNCGSTETGAVGSPAGGMHLILRSDF